MSDLITRSDDERMKLDEHSELNPILLRASLRAALTAKEQAENDLRVRFLSWRGIEETCAKCGGAGERAYPNTTTWAGGIGGQAITSGVCDVCWGTGDTHRKGADLKKIRGDMSTLKARAEAAESALCRAREWLALAKMLNGTECLFHDKHRRHRVPGVERCGKCLYCVIDYALSVHLSSSPCTHETEAKRLREVVKWAINKSLEIAAKEDTTTYPMAFATELNRRAGRKEG